MGRWSREELEAAHDNFMAKANEAALTHDWRPWSDLFTDDAEYVEHNYGHFHGRAEIHQWITTTMAEWPNSEMDHFPHTWCVCDEDRGWWICCVQNRFADPGDGQTYQESNLTVLHYAGDMKFSYEEDAYNPANFAPVVKAWRRALAAHDHPDRGRPPRA
ncbi:MAG TPA: nuclear transport factor 2 family protein [Acidimicrobiales bacterium]|nr:nuclear transport factor 2 family protein [Acidimicrobiales bacterium]